MLCRCEIEKDIFCKFVETTFTKQILFEKFRPQLSNRYDMYDNVHLLSYSQAGSLGV